MEVYSIIAFLIINDKLLISLSSNSKPQSMRKAITTFLKKTVSICTLRPYRRYLSVKQTVWLGLSIGLDIVSAAATAVVPAFFGKAVNLLGEHLENPEDDTTYTDAIIRLYVSVGGMACIFITPLLKKRILSHLEKTLTQQAIAIVHDKAHEMPLMTVQQSKTVIFESYFTALDRTPRLANEITENVMPNGFAAVSGIAFTWFICGFEVGIPFLAYGLLSPLVIHRLLNYFSKPQQKNQRLIERLNRFTEDIYESVEKMETIKLYGHTQLTKIQLNEILRHYLDDQHKLKQLESTYGLIENIMPVLAGTSLVSCMAGHIYQITNINQFIFLFLYIPIFCNSISQFNRSFNSALLLCDHQQQLDDFLKQPFAMQRITIKTPEKPLPDDWTIQEIQFKNISFAYDPQYPLLNDLSFTISTNTITHLQGENGSGKTTILKMLARLVEPDAGSITVNGVDYRDIDETEWRKRLNILPQTISLFAHQSLKYNVLYAHPDFETDIFPKMATTPNADHTAKSKQQQHGDYQTFTDAPTNPSADIPPDIDHAYQEAIEITGLTALSQHDHSEITGQLSGGERQRIGFARLLIKQSSLFALDEPTNTLDRTIAHTLLDTIQTRAHHAPIIIISHHPIDMDTSISTQTIALNRRAQS